MNARKKTKAKTRTKSRTHAKKKTTAHLKQKQETHSDSDHATISSPILATNPIAKACQEVEIGDIGGFGSTEELEEHQKRCNETATEFCGSCGRNLCRNHYDMLHRDHDSASHRPLGPTPI